MRLCYLTESAYEQLKSNIKINLDLYKNEDVWIDTYFGDKNYYIESNIEFNTFEYLIPKNREQVSYCDLINAINLYETLKDLTPNQASNPFLWTYLCHTLGWKYMNKRWPIGDDSESRIKERYLCLDNKISYVRNGLSRLWWAVHLSIDNDSKDKYALTKILFLDQDYFVGIVERDFSMCKNVILGVLRASKTYYDAYGELPKLEVRREWMKIINRKGAITILDMVDSNEIEHETLKYYEDNRKSKE